MTSGVMQIGWATKQVINGLIIAQCQRFPLYVMISLYTDLKHFFSLLNMKFLRMEEISLKRTILIIYYNI